jgi:hypothetical protein
VARSKSTVIPVAVYGCGNSSLKLGQDSRMRMYENRVQRRISGIREKGSNREARKKFTNWSFIISSFNLILLG